MLISSDVLTFFVTLAGHELVWSVQGAEPPEAQSFIH